mmetsp:Transcript_11386/g.30388  ORF Transcript_11386/g.30388 Transcript_11386/m.30388 type:complete len:134 (+) Transcript_11386:134-535(+)
MEDAGTTHMAQLSDMDQFMIMLNVCAGICGGILYYCISLRQKQTAGQRERYFPGPFVSLAEASRQWKVYRQCGDKSDRDTHVCKFCGFAIKAPASEQPGQGSLLSQDLQSEDSKSDPGKGPRRRHAAKKGKKS